MENKYKIEDVKKYPYETQVAVSNIMIANELHKLNQLISKAMYQDEE